MVDDRAVAELANRIRAGEIAVGEAQETIAMLRGMVNECGHRLVTYPVWNFLQCTTCGIERPGNWQGFNGAVLVNKDYFGKVVS